jgi:hypothetical protein
MSGLALAANASNNARGDRARRRRWRPARDAVWRLLEGLVDDGARVGVVGAGNGDDLPLGRLARRAGSLELMDLDAGALARAGHGVARVEDVTGGAADIVIASALAREPLAATPLVSPEALGSYDVIVADLVLTQLLYPALKHAGTLSGAEIDEVLLAHGQALTDGVVARLHASAPVVVVLHDLVGWWKGHQQPFALRTLLDASAEEALALARRGSLPYGCDPWVATRAAGARVVAMRHWRWPFSPGAEYLVFGLVTRRAVGSEAGVD